MELEQRVKALEYEIKILKNEIQRTLKDVQTHVIAKYTASPATADAVMETGIKKVSRAEIRQTQAELVNEAEKERIAKFTAWTNGNIARLGKSRVTRLADEFAERGFLDHTYHKLVLMVASQTSENGPLKAPLTLILDAVLKLDELLDRKPDGEEALTLIEEANIG
ncbi:MAG: hypothetical protein HZC40_26725 [Chloroflexi bacterium]|nr:hypothetical protein [Chloroflexota bacterium]